MFKTKSKRNLVLPINCHVTPGEHSFFAMKEDTIQIQRFLNEDPVVFIHTSVDSGKSTMTKYIVKQFEDYVIIRDPAEIPDVVITIYGSRVSSPHTVNYNLRHCHPKEMTTPDNSELSVTRWLS